MTAAVTNPFVSPVGPDIKSARPRVPRADQGEFTLNPATDPAATSATKEPVDSAYQFDLRQQWEGVIQEVDGDELKVILRDLTGSNPECVAVLPLEEIPAEDLALVKPGAVFYWSIGYKRDPSGQLDRVSSIRMRRLAWSRRELDRIEARAKELESLFGTRSGS